MNRIARNVSIIWRTEKLIAQRRVAVLRSQTGLMMFAGLMAGIAIVMINVSALFALNNVLSMELAALIVAAANLVIAGVVVTIALRINVERELETANEVRDLAVEDLEAELQAAGAEARDLVDNVRSLARNPIGAVAPGLLNPLIGAILKNLKK